ncbi:hypothetical protein MCERE19_04363 [Spirosomataceae bacterium]|jgi:hypothetical protein
MNINYTLTNCQFRDKRTWFLLYVLLSLIIGSVYSMKTLTTDIDQKATNGKAYAVVHGRPSSK